MLGDYLATIIQDIVKSDLETLLRHKWKWPRNSYQTHVLKWFGSSYTTHSCKSLRHFIQDMFENALERITVRFWTRVRAKSSRTPSFLTENHSKCENAALVRGPNNFEEFARPWNPTRTWIRTALHATVPHIPHKTHQHYQKAINNIFLKEFPQGPWLPPRVELSWRPYCIQDVIGNDLQALIQDKSEQWVGNSYPTHI